MSDTEEKEKNKQQEGVALCLSLLHWESYHCALPQREDRIVGSSSSLTSQAPKRNWKQQFGQWQPDLSQKKLADATVEELGGEKWGRFSRLVGISIKLLIQP